MPARIGLVVCCCASIILRLTGCRGASWCLSLRRRGRRLWAAPCRRCRRGGPRFGGGRHGWRRGGRVRGGVGGVWFWVGRVGGPRRAWGVGGSDLRRGLMG